MSKWVIYCIAGLSLAGIQRAEAIATSNDVTSAEAPSKHGYNFDWGYVYNYKGASAVAVDHYWILTAAHVADDASSKTNIVIDGETYFQQEIVFHASADLALVRYDKPFPGYYLIPDSTATVRNKQAIMTGFGRTGPVSATSFSETAGSQGTKRWGTQKIDTDYSYQQTASDGTYSWTGYWLAVNFDLNNTFLEAGGTTFDSGGGIFYYDSGYWKVAGITVYILGNREGNYAVSVRRYTNWIKSVITDYDTDMDGLPDHWEASTGQTEAGADPDGDGFTNYEEWLADSDPTLGSSFLGILEFTNASNLVFSSSSERQYLVEYCENLTNQYWQGQGGWFSGSASQTVHGVSATNEAGFYRVRARVY